MPESKKEYTAVYRQSRDYAQKNGEILDWRQSFRLNIACKQSIEEAVRKGFDGMHLSDDVLDAPLEKFGAERVGYVLANTLQEKSYDGRFSHHNKEWAAAISIPENEANGGRNCEFVVDSHPAVLDGFVSMFRQETREQKRESVLGQLAAMKATAPAHTEAAPKKAHEAAR